MMARLMGYVLHHTGTVLTLNFIDGVSGFVQKAGVVYTVGTGSGNCDILLNQLTRTEKRAFFHFDTSSIPDDATITKVEFLREDDIAQAPPLSTSMTIYLGSWIGSTLDASAADFSGGNDLSLDIFPYGSPTWIDLFDGGIDPTGYIDKTGTSDVSIHDTSGGFGLTNFSFNSQKAKCKLRITYDYDEIIRPKHIQILGANPEVLLP